MKRSKRLQVVLDLEMRREDEALEVLARAREHWDQATQRLKELRQYQLDYQQELRAAAQGRVKATQLQGWQRFISRLGAAISQQQQQVDQTRSQFEQTRDAWREVHERRRGVERYIEECRRQEQRDEDRREQKEMDEAASIRYARRHF